MELNVLTQAADNKLKLKTEKTVVDMAHKNSYTLRLDAAEKAHDKPIRGFFKTVKGMLRHFNPGMNYFKSILLIT